MEPGGGKEEREGPKGLSFQGAAVKVRNKVGHLGEGVGKVSRQGAV